MPEELQLLTLVVAGSSPAPATRRQGSSAVEHENVSPTLVVRSRQMPKELQLSEPVQCRFESCPCCDGRVAQSGRGAVKDFFNTRCRAFEFLVRWFLPPHRNRLRMNAGRITSFGDCINLAFTCHSFWANADRITLVFAGSIPARSLLRKSCLFCRPPGECRQDYNLPRYLSCHY